MVSFGWGHRKAEREVGGDAGNGSKGPGVAPAYGVAPFVQLSVRRGYRRGIRGVGRILLDFGPLSTRRRYGCTRSGLSFSNTHASFVARSAADDRGGGALVINTLASQSRIEGCTHFPSCKGGPPDAYHPSGQTLPRAEPRTPFEGRTTLTRTTAGPRFA